MQRGEVSAAGEWLSQRSADLPPQLYDRLRAMLSRTPDDEVAGQFAAAAIAQLTSLLEHGDSTRAIAADLLAVDAAVTYACESAATDWASGELTDSELEDWAAEFARRISGLASRE